MEPALPAPEGIPADDWAATPRFVQHAFVALLTIVAQQQQQLAHHQTQLAELQARLNQHSQNSSKPPSSDPPSAPPRPARVPRGRAKEMGVAIPQTRHEHCDFFGDIILGLGCRTARPGVGDGSPIDKH